MEPGDRRDAGGDLRRGLAREARGQQEGVAGSRRPRGSSRGRRSPPSSRAWTRRRASRSPCRPSGAGSRPAGSSSCSARARPLSSTTSLAIERDHPGRAHAHLRFDPPFARRVYAGADMVLIPSRYEPCGLTQMIAMRYGAVPVARRTGGLADTVRDAGDPDGNGFMFDEFSSWALGTRSGPRALGVRSAGKMGRNSEARHAVRFFLGPLGGAVRRRSTRAMRCTEARRGKPSPRPGEDSARSLGVRPPTPAARLSETGARPP